MRSRGELLIRSFEPTDLDGIIDVFLRAIRETASKDYSPAQIDAWAQVDREKWALTYQNRRAWVAVSGQSLAGFTDLESSGHLDMMYVHPAYQRRKVATVLLEHVECVARAQGLSKIFTEASITAQPFFLKNGFETLTSQVVEARGEQFANFRMEKLLG